MKRFAGLTALVVAAIVVPVMLSKADMDGNNDGCVDLRDYAIMQSQFTGPDCTPREIVSFFAEGTDEFVLIPEVPGLNGFILTDVVSQRASTVTTITFIQEIGEEEQTKLSVTVGVSGSGACDGDGRSYHFNSGIPFTAGATVRVEISNSTNTQITVSGYTY